MGQRAQIEGRAFDDVQLGRYAGSLQAVEQALQYGPPMVSTATRPAAIQHQGARVDTSRPVPVAPEEAIRQRIPLTILRLSELWKREAAPLIVYRHLRSVVLPPERPNDVFLYSLPVRVDPLQPQRMRQVTSMAHELVALATVSEQLSDLKHSVNDRNQSHSAEATIVLLLCALETRDDDAITRLGVELRRIMKDGTNRGTAEVAAAVGFALQAQTDNVQWTHHSSNPARRYGVRDLSNLYTKRVPFLKVKT